LDKSVEEKWQRKWEEAKVFEADPDEREKFFITFPYPYMNSAPHIGHAYTLSRVDVIARFRRMLGYNVLFPFAFHATGATIYGVAERLRKGDEDQKRALLVAGLPEEEIENFKDPVYIANYWKRIWERVLRKFGVSVDWRRKFITTEMFPPYSKFIEWQYLKLKEMGYVYKGTHPVVWCPNCKSPTGNADRIEGEEARVVEITLIKFKIDDLVLPTATFRPETIFGVTNLWVNPDHEYGIYLLGEEKWVLSDEAAFKLKEQKKDIRPTGERIKGRDLVGKKAKNPVNDTEIIILPAEFVDPNEGSGLVMSVPSHAPYDYAALLDIKREAKKLSSEYGIPKIEIERIEPISIIDLSSEGFGEHPAIEICAEMGIESQREVEKLEEATNKIYKKEFHKGVMKVEPYTGIKVSEAKVEVARNLISSGKAELMYDLSEEVVCRCGTKCHVKVIEDQWFLKYSDEDWKQKVLDWLDAMEIYPEEARAQMRNFVLELRDWAFTRRKGLGTRLPWDKEWMIETLSDSVIYMAFYTIAKHVNQGIGAEQLIPEVFDYVFLGIGDPSQVSSKSGIPKEKLLEMRREFEYWYPVDLRGSGKDLLSNHLVFSIYHHVALWPIDKWPRAYSVNGWVLFEGEKMSKSRGKVINLEEAIEKWGSDLVRITLASSGETLDDVDFREENLRTFESRLRRIEEYIELLGKMKGREIGRAERYLISRLQRNVKEATEMLKKTMTRSAMVRILFNPMNDLKWYFKRVGGIDKANGEVVRECLKKIVLMLCPYTPHFSEEMWSKLGGDGFASLQKWPEPDYSKINEKIEEQERLLSSLIEDIKEIKGLIESRGASTKKVKIFVASDWKYQILSTLREKRNKEEVIKELMSMEEFRKRGMEVIRLVERLFKEETLPIITREEEIEMLREASDFISKETSLEVEILSEEEAKEEKELNKAKQSIPGRPGILLL